MNEQINYRDITEFLVDFLEHENRWITVKELSYLTDMSQKDLFLAACLSEGRIIIDIDKFKARKCATPDDIEALDWMLIEQ